MKTRDKNNFVSFDSIDDSIREFFEIPLPVGWGKNRVGFWEIENPS